MSLLLVHGTEGLNTVFAQKKGDIILRGIIYNSASKRPLGGSVLFIIELKKKTTADADGSYRMTLPKPGIYNVVITSEGMRVYKTTLIVESDTIKNFQMDAREVRGQGITITGKRDIQTVSRHTMTLKQIKETPATFGDSMNAIAALPGVIRTGGDLFGPIIIRGGDQRGIRYLIDDIPVYSPLHYGGMHSVINSNLIDQIDLFSSSFPAEFGSATSSVISIRTIDDVKEFSGYTDLSILAASALVQTCFLRNDAGGISAGSPMEDRKKDDRTAGYILASGRISYIDLIVLPVVGLIMGEKISVVPNYWDYQFKAKYYFNPKHSLTLFAMGSKDYFRLSNNKTAWDGSDPLLTGLKLKTDQMNHGQSLYYTYQPSEKFMNRLSFYSSLKQNYVSSSIPAPGVNLALKGIYIDSRPYVFGLLDKFKIVAIKKYLEIRGGAEYTLYYFTARGRTPGSMGRSVTSDISDVNLVPVILNNNIFNHALGGYAEAKITYEGLTVMPGFRTDYLKRAGRATWDPRLLLSYEFPSRTTISAAGGKYSYFFQTNPAFFDVSPQLCKIGRDSKPEWAFHRAVGLEQEIDLFSIKMEGFWNDFYDLTQRYIHIGPDGGLRHMMNTGRIRAYGAEIMLKKDRREDENGIFGWVSYTYTRSKFRSGLPPYPGIYGFSFNKTGDPWGSFWQNYMHEQNHSLKVILGYANEGHTITGKFMLYSSGPYTPIIFSKEDIDYYNDTNMHRYYPVYGRPNSRHFPVIHRLDIRYSHSTTYSWGYVSWYVEVINVYNYRPIVFERWDYRFPYHTQIPMLHSSNPKRSSYSDSVAFIPNFGVEVKF
ncbi:MAG: TonB-dependent receptor [Spirochaetes bacterium]|nr:TonB-dependent receptor [Spirochaetota bacterium]